jgi:hypothetical protein
VRLSDRALILFTLAAMTVLVAGLLFVVPALAQAPPCITVTHPAPAGDVVDFAQLMPMDAALRANHHKDPGWYGNVVFANKIVFTKFSPAGDNWDVFSFDNDFVYFFATGVPLDYTSYPSPTSSPWASRYAQLGFPGTRVVSRCNSWPRVVNCERQPTGPLTMILITEVWGPFPFDFSNGPGGIGHQDNVIALKYYWDCQTGDPMSCGHLEENWYVAPYGGVRWAHSSNPNHDGNFSSPPHVETFDVLADGGPGFVRWCDPEPVHIPTRSMQPLTPVIGRASVSATLLGTLYGSRPNPGVVGAAITVTQGEATHATTSGMGGTFTVADLSLGPATVSVTSTACFSVSVPVTLHAGANNINIQTCP